MTTSPHVRDYQEHLVPYHGATLYVRHYPGTGPAFVLMHGFPDNFHIYDLLVPLLEDRQIITFDFLGWGASAKPTNYLYTSQHQEQELQAVLDALQVDQVIPVAHDSSGPVAINWSLDHLERVSSLVLLNTYYMQTPTLRFPEFISLFADPAYAALTRDMIRESAVVQWLLTWQGGQFGGGQQIQELLLPLIGQQFAGTPSIFPSFIGLTRDLPATLEANARRVPALKAFERPVSIIFGENDRYLDSGVAQSLHEMFPTSELSLLPNGGHWPQIDGTAEVARLLLSRPTASQAQTNDHR
jgi:haloalkane dehalogenase